MAFCPALQNAACLLTGGLCFGGVLFVWLGFFGFFFFNWVRIKSGIFPLKYYLLDTLDVSVKI